MADPPIGCRRRESGVPAHSPFAAHHTVKFQAESAGRYMHGLNWGQVDASST